jgi:hypothetical protein
MAGDERIAALEASVAELRAYLPMLARMAWFEKYNDKSFPHLIDEVRQLLEVVTYGSYTKVMDTLAPGNERMTDEIVLPPSVVVRASDEAISAAAGELDERHHEAERKAFERIPEMDKKWFAIVPAEGRRQPEEA